jgi:hemolysin activation/secretion protein
MMLHPRLTLPASAALLLLGCPVLGQGVKQQNTPPPLPEKVLPNKEDPLPVPLDLDLLLTPEMPAEPPRQRLQKATDAMQPVLPPLDPSALPGPQVKVFVKRFKFTGNHVFTDHQLRKAVAKYEGREITSDELEAARVALTKMYIDAGYIASGAILPDQDPTKGEIHFELVEGKLAQIDLSGNRWFRSWWLRHVMRRAAGSPVNFNKLKTGLQLLRQNEGISQINAELKPGAKPGESILHVTVKDTQPFRLGLEINNHRPPSVSEGIAELYFSDLNLTGHNDPLELRWGVERWNTDGDIESPGFDEIQASYEFPVSPWGTTLRVHAGRGATNIIDETFAALGITSETEEFGLTLRQPIIETLRDTVSLSVGVEKRHSQTFVLGQPFSLSPGAVDGESDVFALRATAEWINRSQLHVFALRSTFSWGLYEFGATRATGTAGGVSSGAATGGAALADVPDGKFFSWVGQAQYVRRILDTPAMRKKPETAVWNSLRESLLVVRANAQFSDEPLLALEQFAMGGYQSVRGYRENQLLRDNGFFASIEWRIPVWMRADKTPILSIAPFIDYGTCWNTVSENADDSNATIASAGLGLLLNANKHVQATVYWGCPFTDPGNKREALQDYGFHLSFSINAF